MSILSDAQREWEEAPDDDDLFSDDAMGELAENEATDMLERELY